MKQISRLLAPLLLALLFLAPACPGPHPPQPPLIKVTVCEISLTLPNEFCPSTIVKEFKQGAAPTTSCIVHKPPDPPIITKVAAPWQPGGPLLSWSPTLYSTLCGSEAVIPKQKLNAVDESMAIDGINMRRDFAWFADQSDAWQGNYLLPWNEDWSWNELYWKQLNDRLQTWCGDRDGGQIIAILDACSMYQGDSWEVNPLNKLATSPAAVFWPGPAREKVTAFASELVRRTAKFAPRIIYETRNEGSQIVGFDALQSYDRAIISALRAAQVPVTHIATNWYDSSLFYDTILNDLEEKGLAFTHQVNSEKSADWYRDSPGKQGLAAIGDRPSSDGPDFYESEGAAQGLKWYWLPAGQARRASNPQITYIVATMQNLSLPGYEFLSASAFQRSCLPNFDDAITIGHAERIAMVAGLAQRRPGARRLILSMVDRPYFRRGRPQGASPAPATPPGCGDTPGRIAIFPAILASIAF